MERLKGPIDPCLLGEQLDVEISEEGFFNTESWRFEEVEADYSMPSLDDKIPFLQMLQGVESPPFFAIKEPNLQTLLKLQHLKKPWDMNNYVPEAETQAQTLELESCVTNDIADFHSPVKSESQDLQNPRSNSCIEREPNNKRANSTESLCKENNSGSSFQLNPSQTMIDETHFSKSSPLVPKERKKRKRARAAKNKEEVENQRMTHIAVERNRRRQMNDHLNSLRALMPPSYVQRGDQASIVGGAIDFVKELEQLLQSLEAQKRIRKAEAAAVIGISPNRLLACEPGCKIERESCNYEEETKVNRKSEAAEIEVTAVQNHVNLKIQCERRPGQLLRAIVALEDLRLTVLHLNITSSETTVVYSFNLKIEDGCKVGSADEVASTVRKIFSMINGS